MSFPITREALEASGYKFNHSKICPSCDVSIEMWDTYIYDGRNSMRAYQCPHCGQTGPRIRPLRDHMGMTMNKRASCPILKAQDEQRRQKDLYDDR